MMKTNDRDEQLLGVVRMERYNIVIVSINNNNESRSPSLLVHLGNNKKGATFLRN
jgi:hypothetical protein